jgi:hypothetical protein
MSAAHCTSDIELMEALWKRCARKPAILLVDGEPHQVHRAPDQVLRFVGCPITRVLRTQVGDRYDMNAIVLAYRNKQFTRRELRRFYIAIGYSVSGFLELTENRTVKLALP